MEFYESSLTVNATNIVAGGLLIFIVGCSLYGIFDSVRTGWRWWKSLDTASERA